MPLGIRGANPIWAEFDLSGKIFDDTYYMWVLENQIPYIPAVVYHDPDLNTPWTQPIQFLGNGTLPNDIYFENGIVYRLEFRQSDGLSTPTQQDPLIYLVENYVPGDGGSTPVDTVAFASSNQVTNPQFALVDFSSPYTFSGTDPTPIQIGPGWFLELAGTGTVTINQIPLTSVNPTPSNAPYALQLTMSGWNANSVFLRQRFYQSGVLWANKIVSTAITARVQGVSVSISASLIDSMNSPLGQLLSTPVDESFNEYTGYAELEASTDTDTPPAAYIDYKLSLPSNVDIYVTSIQLVVQDLPLEPSFEQDSINRQIDHTFNVYKDPIFFKPIPSYLIAWDFPLNPALANGSSVAASSNANSYTWDQTILYQSTVSKINTTRATNDAMTLTSVDSSSLTQPAIIQYLPQHEVRNMLQNRLSVNIQGNTTQAGGLVCTVSLWYTTNSAVPVLPLGIVTTLDANGHPSAVAAGWTEMVRENNLGNAQFTLGSSFENFGFNGWDETLSSAPTTAKFFAIVLGTAPITNTFSLTLNSISVVPGDIPTIPAPQSFQQVLSECQTFYEKSYGTTVLPGTSSTDGALSAEMLSVRSLGVNDTLVSRQFGFRFNTQKISSSTIVNLYSVTGTLANITGYLYSSGSQIAISDIAVSGNWAATSGKTGIVYLPLNVTTLLAATTGATTTSESFIKFQYTADSRLGIV